MKCLIALSFLLLAPLAATHASDFHVATPGSDVNPGTKKSPFRTVQHAADLAQPGDVITVHEGVYREWISPPRGGESDAKRIVYQAAPGEKVVITGSEPVKGWAQVTHDTWKTTIPNSFFGKFNPYADRIHGDWFDPKGRQHHTGAVYLNGDWLVEAAELDDVIKSVADNALWFAVVGATNTTVWAHFPGVNPNEASVEINVRQTVFTPSKTGINFITVRGFDLRNAATPWVPPSAGQIGIISAYWCKGWVIEDNEISYSKCCGAALGKYSDEFDNTNDRGAADPYTDCVRRALKNGWNKETVGSHLVRNNHIHHCEQAGIVGSMGGAFSAITSNTIHDIHVRRLFTGAEMAGIKLHGAIDVEISHNHIYRCNRGLWLDWMAQGTRVTGNLFHDNAAASVNWPENWEALSPGGDQDMFIEVNHGPILVDNNLFLSPYSGNDRSQGVAFVHNLIAGAFRIVPHDGRKTPYHKPHSTEVMALHDNPCGDHRFYNNLFVERCNLNGFDAAQLPVFMAGNAYLKGSKPSKFDTAALVLPDFNPGLKLVEKADGWYLTLAEDPTWRHEAKRQLVTTELLGKVKVPDCAFENADGSPLRITTDYFGKKRDEENPMPGPFETPGTGLLSTKVW